jgi:hypothetical protein
MRHTVVAAKRPSFPCLIAFPKKYENCPSLPVQHQPDGPLPSPARNPLPKRNYPPANRRHAARIARPARSTVSNATGGLWDDGSVRWANLEFLADLANHQSLFLRSYPEDSLQSLQPVCTEPPQVELDQGRLKFALLDPVNPKFPSLFFASLEITGSWGSTTIPLDQAKSQTQVANRLGASFESVGTLKLESLALPIEFQLRGKHWSTGQIDLSLCIRNPNPADHPGGNWDLGNQGSVYIDDLSLHLFLDSSESTSKLLVRETFGATVQQAEKSIELFQASSGGKNWKSSNHIDRNRKIPMPFRGYRLCVDGAQSTAERATPYVAIESDGATLAVACNRFWQNFPTAIRANGKTIEVGLLPKESGYEHELQGGEQKTFELAAYLGDAPANSLPLDGYLSDPYAVIDREYLESTGIFSEKSLGPLEDSAGVLYEQLVRQAIEGDDSFFVKREKIDEYGWRHYGDVYGDHEAVYHKGPTPMISHYNNQYESLPPGTCHLPLATMR